MALCSYLLQILFMYITSVYSTSFDILGAGLHRQLNITLSPDRHLSTALLSWQITPDFYVDVYELQRRKFQFRVDDGETKFIDIEIPAHQAGFHSFSCNLASSSVMLPFHIRYQPAGPHDSSEILIPSPEVNFIQPSGEIESEYGDPFYLTVPVANTKHLFLVNFSTLFAAVFGALYLAREILRK